MIVEQDSQTMGTCSIHWATWRLMENKAIYYSIFYVHVRVLHWLASLITEPWTYITPKLACVLYSSWWNIKDNYPPRAQGKHLHQCWYDWSFLLCRRYKPEKTAGISLRHHWFPREMTSEKQAQKFHTNDGPLPRSGSASDCWKFASSNQKHYPDLGSDT